MKRVLWISRHQMSQEQLQGLEKAMGEPVELVWWTESVSSIDELRPALEQVDAVAAVLPLELMAQLIQAAGNKPVLRAVGERRLTGRWLDTPNGGREKESQFVYLGWQQVLRVEVEVKPL